MTPLPIEADTPVRDVMDTHPDTVAVFISRRMHCPGCAMSAFITVGEAARTYGIDTGELVASLRAAAAGAPREGRP